MISLGSLVHSVGAQFAELRDRQGRNYGIELISDLLSARKDRAKAFRKAAKRFQAYPLQSLIQNVSVPGPAIRIRGMAVLSVKVKIAQAAQ